MSIKRLAVARGASIQTEREVRPPRRTRQPPVRATRAVAHRQGPGTRRGSPALRRWPRAVPAVLRRWASSVPSMWKPMIRATRPRVRVTTTRTAAAERTTTSPRSPREDGKPFRSFTRNASSLREAGRRRTTAAVAARVTGPTDALQPIDVNVLRLPENISSEEAGRKLFLRRFLLCPGGSEGGFELRYGLPVVRSSSHNCGKPPTGRALRPQLTTSPKLARRLFSGPSNRGKSAPREHIAKLPTFTFSALTLFTLPIPLLVIGNNRVPQTQAFDELF